MAIDHLEVSRMELRDFGITAQIEWQDVQVLFDLEPVSADPYLNERRHDGPVATVPLADLISAHLWPLPVDLIRVAGIDYRVVRTDQTLAGEIMFYLREAE